MSKVRRARRPQKPAPKGELKKPRPVWFVTLMAFVLPGSGQWLNGAPVRGMTMQFGMLLGAYLTYQLTTPEISLVGRLAGGLLIYVFSIVDANGIATRRVKAWARIEAAQAEQAHEAGRRQGGDRCQRRRGAPRRRAAEASGWRLPAAGDLRGLRHLNGADSHAGEGRPGPRPGPPRVRAARTRAERRGAGVGRRPAEEELTHRPPRPDNTDQGCP